MSRAVLTLSALACSNAGLFCTSAASAAEWLITPNARVAADYADNPRMLHEGGESSAGAVGELSASIKRRTPRTDLSLQPRLRSSRYREDESLDSDYQFFDAAFSYRTQRVDWAASAGFTRDSTLTSELGSTGLVQVNRTHEGIRVSAGPTVTLTERTTAGAQAYWLNNHYLDAEFTGLTDYDYGSLSVFSTYALSEKGQLTITAQSGELRVPSRSGANQQDSMLRLGWRYQPFSLWTLEASAGPSYVKSDFSSNDGAVYMLEVVRRAERWTFNASASQDVAPTGRGELTRRERIGIGLTSSITQYLSAGITLAGIRNEDLLSAPGTLADDVRYGRVDLQTNWRFAEDWSLSFAVGAATQSYASRPQSAENYRASLGIVWNAQAQPL